MTREWKAVSPVTDFNGDTRLDRTCRATVGDADHGFRRAVKVHRESCGARARIGEDRDVVSGCGQCRRAVGMRHVACTASARPLVCKPKFLRIARAGKEVPAIVFTARLLFIYDPFPCVESRARPHCQHDGKWVRVLKIELRGVWIVDVSVGAAFARRFGTNDTSIVGDRAGYVGVI